MEKVGYRYWAIVLLLSWRYYLAEALSVPIDVVTPRTPNPLPSSLLSGIVDGPSLLGAMAINAPDILPGFEKDQVVRVLDANTVKLKKNGIITLAGVRMPTPGMNNFQFPVCLSYTPAYKMRQLLPTNSDVWVKVGSTVSTGKTAQAVVVRSDDTTYVNQELIRTGFGKVQKITSSDLQGYLDIDSLYRLQDLAQSEGIGIFQRCDMKESGTFEAQFEPLELTMETQWGDDGGKLVLRQKEMETATPINPGDIKGQ